MQFTINMPNVRVYEDNELIERGAVLTLDESRWTFMKFAFVILYAVLFSRTAAHLITLKKTQCEPEEQ